MKGDGDCLSAARNFYQRGAEPILAIWHSTPKIPGKHGVLNRCAFTFFKSPDRFLSYRIQFARVNIGVHLSVPFFSVKLGKPTPQKGPFFRIQFSDFILNSIKITHRSPRLSTQTRSQSIQSAMFLILYFSAPWRLGAILFLVILNQFGKSSSQQCQSFFVSRSLTTCGLAWPLVFLITWPTKKPISLVLPAR